MNRVVTWKVLPETSVYSEADVNWLNACGLKLKIDQPKKMSLYDSGWCDAATGHQIITSGHEIYVTTETPDQETWVKLYWDRRAYEFNVVQYEAINTMNAFLKG